MKNEEEFKRKDNSNYDSNSIDYKEKQKQIDTNSLNQLLSVIYDDEFVLMINDLSHAIKIYNKSMIQFVNQMKLLLSKTYTLLETSKEQKEDETSTIPTLFNSIETDYKTFFSTAKIIFKKMKKYRNERLESINKIPLGEKNLKFCFINVNKNYGSELSGRDNSQNKTIEKKDDNNYIKSFMNKENKETINDTISNTGTQNSSNININNESDKLYEENVELKKKIFNLEKKIEIMGNNKKNIITNNINNISNYHLPDYKNLNEMELIRENKNVVKILKNLVNILEYEKSPDYSFKKNTFDNMEEISE